MKTEISPEDSLRLNVLLAGDVHAVRIDEGAMTLYALTPKGEARVSLHRNCRPDLYVTRVRELLGGHALGSPGGYPVHLRRWSRMGHASPKNLEAMLKLGEPEAVTAVALAPTLTDELARRAWWALPTMEVARYMLGHAGGARGQHGQGVGRFPDRAPALRGRSDPGHELHPRRDRRRAARCRRGRAVVGQGQAAPALLHRLS